MSPALQQPTYEKSIFQAPFTDTSMASPTTGNTGGVRVQPVDGITANIIYIHNLIIREIVRLHTYQRAK